MSAKETTFSRPTGQMENREPSRPGSFPRFIYITEIRRPALVWFCMWSKQNTCNLMKTAVGLKSPPWLVPGISSPGSVRSYLSRVRSEPPVQLGVALNKIKQQHKVSSIVTNMASMQQLINNY